MAMQLSSTTPLQEGIIGGTIGTVTLAFWFLILDTMRGHALYTPAVLGVALFHGQAGLHSLGTFAVTVKAAIAFMWVHWLVSVVLSGIASWLLGRVEHNPDLGFGVLLLFVLSVASCTAAVTLFAQPVLHALTWTVFIGNPLAIATMGGYFWHQYSHLDIRP